MKEADRLIGTLERDLKALILEWERFFSGDRRVPPEADKTRLERRLRQLSEHQSLRGATRFRLEQLQHRFGTYAALWERQLRQREEGRALGSAGGRRVETATGRTAASAPAPLNTPASTSVEGSRPRGLYERWVEAKRSVGQEPGMSREQFEARLEAQRVTLEKKLGRPVEFDVSVRDGAVRLAARPKKKKG